MPAINVIQTGSRFEAHFKFDYATKDLVKAAGFRFDGTRKVWYTQDPTVAAKVSSPDLAKALNAEAQAKREADAKAIAASSAVSADVAVPFPAGLSARPYQLAGIAYALGRAATLIGDEPGLGKTIQAIGIVNADPSIGRVLVICPASLKLNWRLELVKWLARPLTVGIANGGFPTTDVVIVNYEQVAKWRKHIDAFAPDLLVVDEVHLTKNPEAQRTKAILGYYDRRSKAQTAKPIAAARRVFMTGTPIVNRPIELWTLVQALDPNGLGKSWWTYAHRYCNAHRTEYGMDVSGSSNLDELQSKLRAACMVRRLKADVLKELPAKRRQIIVLPAESAEAKASIAREQGIVPEEYRDAVEALAEVEVGFEDFSRVRHETALAKVPQVIEHIREALEETDKVVVMAHHLDVVGMVRAAFPDISVVLTGETPIEQRQEAVSRFQSDPGTRLFVGTIRAAGVGITLTAASRVVFVELDPVPGIMSQAEDRCHRIGQDESVLVQHLVFDGSIDARIAHILVGKQSVLDEAMDGGGVLAEVPTLAEPKPVAEKVQSREVVAIEDDVTEYRDAIHRALKILAGMCDGAQELDGVGFNKLDTAIGHSLACAVKLTPKQAILGRKIARKYHRQLGSELVAAMGA